MGRPSVSLILPGVFLISPSFAGRASAARPTALFDTSGDRLRANKEPALDCYDRLFSRDGFYRVENGKIMEHWDVIEPVSEESVNDKTMF